MPIPNVPTNVLVASGNGQVYISWSPVVGATSASTGVPLGSTGPSSGLYDVLRSSDGVNFSIIASPRNTFYSDIASSAAGGASTGVILSYRVRANGNNGQSGASSPIATTLVNFGQVSLGQMRLASQQRADMVNSDFVSKAEWNNYINKSYMELYDILVQTYADDYYVANPYSFVFDSRNPPLYDLPNNVYKLLGVEVQLNGSAYLSLKKFQFQERNNYIYGNTTVPAIGITNLKYRLVGNQLEFIPVPASGQTIRIWFIPRPITLLADSDILDGVSGWDEYIVVDCAIKAMQKEESDVSILMAQKQALLGRITAAASNRDAGVGERATDARRLDGSYSGYDGPSGGW